MFVGCPFTWVKDPAIMYSPVLRVFYGIDAPIERFALYHWKIFNGCTCSINHAQLAEAVGTDIQAVGKENTSDQKQGVLVD